MTKNFERVVYVAVAIFMLFHSSSCVTQRQVEYLQELNDTTYKSYTEAQFPDYKLKPNDELYIQIRSLDEGTAGVFSYTTGQAAGTSGSLSPYSASIMSYSIDKEGFLLLPLVGSLYVKNKTLSQVNIMVRDSLNHILNQPIVTIKLVNRYISVLGEVRTPGHFPYSQEKLTVFDALSMAGDITEYGNRQDVMLIRNEDGNNIRMKFDLTSSEMLASAQYNLRPNDILYVKPIRNKFWGMRQFPFGVLFSAITTTILIYNVITR